MVMLFISYYLMKYPILGFVYPKMNEQIPLFVHLDSPAKQKEV
jgi:hypothetical protein